MILELGEKAVTSSSGHIVDAQLHLGGIFGNAPKSVYIEICARSFIIKAGDVISR